MVFKQEDGTVLSVVGLGEMISIVECDWYWVTMTSISVGRTLYNRSLCLVLHTAWNWDFTRVEEFSYLFSYGAVLQASTLFIQFYVVCGVPQTDSDCPTGMEV